MIAQCSCYFSLKHPSDFCTLTGVCYTFSHICCSKYHRLRLSYSVRALGICATYIVKSPTIFLFVSTAQIFVCYLLRRIDNMESSAAIAVDYAIHLFDCLVKLRILYRQSLPLVFQKPRFFLAQLKSTLQLTNDLFCLKYTFELCQYSFPQLFLRPYSLQVILVSSYVGCPVLRSFSSRIAKCAPTKRIHRLALSYH